MLNSGQIAQLIEPVIIRANADEGRFPFAFADRAANVILDRLEIDSYVRKQPCLNPPAAEYARLATCQWIDSRVRDFLVCYPEALGVEVGAGLSTRFHRLSMLLDWPKFSWLALDTSDIADCFHYVFPPTDNRKWLACELSRNQWIEQIPWLSDTPKIVILGDSRAPIAAQDMTHICSAIACQLTPQSGPVRLLAIHERQWLVPTRPAIHRFELFAPPPTGSWLARALRHFFSKGAESQQPTISHLTIAPQLSCRRHPCN